MSEKEKTKPKTVDVELKLRQQKSADIEQPKPMSKDALAAKAFYDCAAVIAGLDPMSRVRVLESLATFFSGDAKDMLAEEMDQ